MANSASDTARELRTLSLKLRELHARILQVEQRRTVTPQGIPLLDRLANDPAWSWLRAISSLIAEIDHALANDPPLTESDRAVVGAHVRGTLFGEGDMVNEDFLFRYRQLLQIDAPIASMHGELRGLLRSFPAEAQNELERHRARRNWAGRHKQRPARN